MALLCSASERHRMKHKAVFRLRQQFSVNVFRSPDFPQDPVHIFQ